MGMAASQARFLGLTARKTNVEYEGQQINQQRTTLANQTANYYNQLLGMSVPTPPSVSDYTKTVYTFQDGNLSNSITSLVAQANGLYKVSYVASWQNDFAPVSNGVAVITQDEKFVYTQAGIDYTLKRDTTDKTKYSNTTYSSTGIFRRNGSTWKFEDGGISTPVTVTDKSDYMVGSYKLRKLNGSIPTDDPYYNTLSPDQKTKALAEEGRYESLLNEKYGTPTGGWLVRYVENTTSGVWEPYFYNADNVKEAIYDDNGQSQSTIKVYKIGSAIETDEIKGVDARLEKDATGRYIKITLNAGSPNEVTYALTTNTSTDQVAYNDAMNQYEFDKAKYDQSIQEVNTKIEIIQAQDKDLELRLKQLDTEQKAIDTEMEAVKKVIDKNTETSFKTFG